MRDRRSRWATALLVVVLVALLATPLLVHHAGGQEGSFGGTDAAATSALTSQGVTPWFRPLFNPGSAEVESGLFALQAAVGGLILGFALGRLGGRRSRTAVPRETTAGPAADAPAAGTSGSGDRAPEKGR